MIKGFETVNGLNKANLFEGIYYHQSLNQLSKKDFDRYLSTVGNAVNGLANIKYNYNYGQFVESKLNLNIDLARSFHNLKKTPLILSSISESQDPISFSTIVDGDPLYCANLDIRKDFLQTRTDNNISTGIGHEFGEALIIADRLPNDYDQFINNERGQNNNTQKNWASEFTADKISMAINPDNNIGLLNNSFKLSTKINRLNKAYTKNLIPDLFAAKIADFCLARDTILLEIEKHLVPNDVKIIDKLLAFIDIGLSNTHPTTITRAVRADKFAKQCINFLNKPKP